jgi:hypothetical protein
LKKDPFVIGIQSQLKIHHQVQKISSDHVKLEFQDCLFYHDGILYVLDGLARLYVLQAKYNALITSHFGFNKTMELMFQDYWWP